MKRGGRRNGYLISILVASDDAELPLHLFERHTFCFRIEKGHHKKLKNHHSGEEHEGVGAGRSCQEWEGQRDDAVHEPVGKAAEALTLGADLVGKNLSDVDPDDGALREREKRDETDE